MKAFIVLLLLLLPFKLDAQISKIIQGKGFEGIIFTKDYNKLLITNSIDSLSFTPSNDEITLLENQLKKEIKLINREMINQGENLGPIIHKNLTKYKRQYLGVISPEGKRSIYVNFIWNDDSLDKLKKHWFFILDGSSYYWEIKFEIDNHRFYDFNVNGYG